MMYRSEAVAALLRHFWHCALGSILAVLCCGRTLPAHASCDQIPGTVNTFRGSLGSVDRPFAGPGDFVELRLLPDCDAGSPGFAANASEHVVTVVFTPPDAGPRHVVVLAPDCDALAAQLQSCGALPNVMPPTCRRTTPTDVEVVEDDLGRRLRVRFPDTDDLFEPPNDDRTFTGPATLAVSSTDAPLPCDLANGACTEHPGLIACIDTLFALDGKCGTAPDEVFSHFTALPPPNDYQALCADPAGLCSAKATELRFTTDAAGNLLLPMDWRGVLVTLHLDGQQTGDGTPATVSIPRLVRALAAARVPGTTHALRIPGSDFVQSYSVSGARLPPVFEPQVDPSTPNALILFGSADAPASVLRIARRSPAFKQCTGGAADGQPCTTASDCTDGVCGSTACVDGARNGQTCATDGECAGGECGPSLFDFRPFLAAGVGPVVLQRFGPGTCEDSGVPCQDDSTCGGSRCVSYQLEAQEPVPLDGLIESSDLFVTVVPEAIEGRDLNGDGDMNDDVLLLSNRRTGVRQPIGVAHADGLAATRLRQPPFSYAAVAIEGRITAFLEAEPHQGYEDANGDGDHFDTILRVFESSDTIANELTAGLNLAVEAEPAINGRSLAVSDGLVFFRVSEADNTRRRLSRVSMAADGTLADGPSQHPSLSRDGRQVAFESAATNLLSPLQPRAKGSGPGALNAEPTAYVHDRTNGIMTRLRVVSDLVGLDTPTLAPWLSFDGRYVAVEAADLIGVKQIFVVDRDADGNGVFDEPGGVRTTPMSVNAVGELAEYDALFPSLSPDGRFSVFVSKSAHLTGSDPRFPTSSVLITDRDADGDGVFDDSPPVAHNAGLSHASFNAGGVIYQVPSVSDDGRYVAWSSFERDIVPDDHNELCINLGSSSTNCPDVFVRDRLAVQTERVSVSSGGEEGNAQSLTPTMSGDGRYVAFVSAASNLVPGDTNGVVDVFVHDRQAHTTTRVSVSSEGDQGNAPSFDRTLSISADGRYIAFSSRASNLVPDDTNALCAAAPDESSLQNCTDVFVHDQLTGFTERVSVAADGTQGDDRSGSATISGDGHTVAFESAATSLLPGSTDRTCNATGDAAQPTCQDIFVSELDPNDLAHDLSGDGDVNDTVLGVLDTQMQPARMTVLGPAASVAVAAGRAAFLLPESALNTGGAPGSDRNADGDTTDTVVQLYQGRSGNVENLQRAAVAVALSDQWVAALVSERDQGHTDFNGDGDTDDTVVQVRPVSGGEWINIGQAADTLDVSGSLVAFITPEAAQGRDLNNDGDTADRVLQLYDATRGELLNTGQTAEEFVLGTDLVAFRTSEAAQGNTDLNGDGDTGDFVMQVYDAHARQVVNTGQAAIPCRLAACDPRIPYRVLGGIVKFLELESDQQEDLNGDGDQNDLILRTFNVPMAHAEMAAAHASGRAAAVRQLPYSRTRAAEVGVLTGTLTTIGAVSVGICTDNGRACASAADCDKGGKCYLPPGGCIRNLGTPCDPTLSNNPCGEREFCVPVAGPGRGLCYARDGICRSDSDCVAPAHCQDAGDAVDRLVNPLSASAAGSEVFTSGGACIEDLGRACDAGAAGVCGAGAFCARGTTGVSTCQRRHGSCRTDADCPRVSKCQRQLIVAAVNDSDGDGIADPFDNCPRVPNPGQEHDVGAVVGRACSSGSGDTTSPTPTATVSPTLTPTATPTSTATHRHSGGGCSLSGPSREHAAATLWLAVVALGLWLRRERLRRALLLGVLLGVAMPAGVPARAASLCAGDCDASGSITVDELVTLVNATLGNVDASACGAGDVNRDGQITADELVAAVSSATNGCPPAPAVVAATTQVVTRALSYLSSLQLLISAGITGSGSPDNCDVGGMYTSRCEDDGSEFIRIPVTLTACGVATSEGTVVLDGVMTIRGVGLCPSVLFPGDITIELTGSTRLGASNGTPLLQSDVQVTGAIDAFAFGAGPCRIKGGRGSITGTVRYQTPPDREVTVDFSDTQLEIQLSQFQANPLCDPGTVVLGVDGLMRIRDTYAQPSVTVDAKLHGVAVTLRRLDGVIEISGTVEAAGLGGSAQLRTIEPLVLEAGAPCFTGGILDVTSPYELTRIAYGPGGSVQIDAAADGVVDASFDSCLDLPRSGG